MCFPSLPFPSLLLFSQQACSIFSAALDCSGGRLDTFIGQSLADTLFSLGECFLRMGEYAGAEHALTVCLFTRSTLFGCHVDTLNVYRCLGELFDEQRRCARGGVTMRTLSLLPEFGSPVVSALCA